MEDNILVNLPAEKRPRRKRGSATEKDKQEYMKEYMASRYLAKKEETLLYNNSLKCKKRNNLSQEDFVKYGLYLNDFNKLATIKAKIPNEIWLKCLTDLNA